MSDETRTEPFRVSPLFKLRLFLGGPWAFGLIGLFLAGAPAWVLDQFDRTGTVSIPVYVGFYGVLIAMMAYAAYASFKTMKRQTAMFRNPKVTNARVEGRESIDYIDSQSQRKSVQYVYELSLADEAGDAWRAKFRAPEFEGVLEVGDWVECLYQADDRSNVTPICFMPAQALIGDDGVVRPERMGVLWGYLGLNLFIAVEWVLVFTSPTVL